MARVRPDGDPLNRPAAARFPGFAGGLRPGLRALRERDVVALRSDLVAGLTVAAFLIPQVMAYAAVAGLPAVAGLWAAVAALGAYAVLGSSRLLSVGPESTTALLTATTLAPLAAGDPARYAGLAAALAVLVGVVCLLGWLARLGFLADLLSRPVLVGYLVGIALFMIVGQLENVTGVPVDGHGFLDELASFAGHVGQLHGPTVAMAAAVLLLLVGAGTWLPRAPGPLVAVLLATAASALFALDLIGIHVVGPVPEGLPVPAWPPVTTADLLGLAPAALGLAVVAYSDDVLTARAFAARQRHPLDADQELLALGAANLGTGFLQGFPISSSASRTTVGHAVGGRSQLTSVVALVVVLAVLTAGGPLLAAFPTAALGALVVYAALRLIDLAELRRFSRFRRSELVLALATTTAVLAVGVLYGVLIAAGLSILDLLRRVSRPHDGVLGYVAGLAGMHDVDDYPSATTVPGLVVYRYDAPLCFANAENFRHRALATLDAAPDARWLLLNMEAVIEMDITAADAVHQLCDELDRRGVVAALARVKQDLLPDLRGSGLVDRIGADHIFPTLPTAVAAFQDQRHLEQPPTA